MFNPFALGHKYRELRAYHKYSYPFFFLVIGTIKTMSQIGMVTAAVWFTYPIAHKFFNPTIESLQPSQATATSNSPDSVEILAIATDDKTDNQFRAITTTISRSDNNVFDATRVFKLDSEQYTIQFRSSPDKKLLQESAETFTSDYPIIVFPFKKTSSNRLVYGFSSGVYDSLESATAAIENMPASARAHDPWIRPIGDLQKQVAISLSENG